MRMRIAGALMLLAFSAFAAERQFDFSGFRTNQTLPGFRSAVTGTGKPGEWKVILDDVAPLLAPLNRQRPGNTKQAVLAQLSQDSRDEHFPILIYESEVFGDFTLTTKVKTVKGGTEQMAGIAFRIQNERNY